MMVSQPWRVIVSPTDPEMYAVQGAYLVADSLPLEDATLISAAPDLEREIAEARTALSILRTQIMVWRGVPERLKERIDAATAKARGVA